MARMACIPLLGWHGLSRPPLWRAGLSEVRELASSSPQYLGHPLFLVHKMARTQKASQPSNCTAGPAERCTRIHLTLCTDHQLKPTLRV